MAQITSIIQISMMPTIPELLDVISAVVTYYPNREKEIMKAISAAINERIEELENE